MNILKLIIRYLLLLLCIIIIYGSIAFPEIGTNIFSFLFIFYIWLYTNITKEIGNGPQKPENPNKYFNKYIGPHIQKKYDIFADYFSLTNIFSAFFKFDTKGKLIYKSKLEKNLFYIFFFFIIMTLSVMYIISIIIFIVTNPIISMILKNFLISILELPEFTLKKVLAMEDPDAPPPSQNFDTDLNKDTITPINPLITTMAIGMAGTLLFRRKNLIETMSVFKQVGNEGIMQDGWKLIKTSSASTTEIFAIGATTTALLTIGEYYFLHDNSMLEAVQYTKLNDPIATFNQYQINKNAEQLYPVLMNKLENATKLEELDTIRDTFHKLPDHIRLKNAITYENQIIKARERIKQ